MGCHCAIELSVFNEGIRELFTSETVDRNVDITDFTKDAEDGLEITLGVTAWDFAKDEGLGEYEGHCGLKDS